MLPDNAPLGVMHTLYKHFMFLFNHMSGVMQIPELKHGVLMEKDQACIYE